MVHDMWSHQDLGSMDSGFTTELSTHASRMVHIIPTSLSGNRYTPYHAKISTVPAAPDWVMVDRNDQNSVTITWNPVYGAESYTVYRKTINRFGFSSGYTPIAANLTEPNFEDKTATFRAGGSYSYVVTGKNSIGESAKSPKAQTDSQSFVLVVIPMMLFISVIILIKLFSKIRDKYQLFRTA
jgi:hypothetical protein